VLSEFEDLRHCLPGQVFEMEQMRQGLAARLRLSLSSRVAGCGSSFGTVGLRARLAERQSKTLYSPSTGPR
jgi:hypothetical protein